MAAPIQSPAKCEVRSVIRFLNAKGDRPAEIHKQIVAVYGNAMNSLVSSPKETLSTGICTVTHVYRHFGWPFYKIPHRPSNLRRVVFPKLFSHARAPK